MGDGESALQQRSNQIANDVDDYIIDIRLENWMVLITADIILPYQLGNLSLVLAFLTIFTSSGPDSSCSIGGTGSWTVNRQKAV